MPTRDKLDRYYTPKSSVDFAVAELLKATLIDTHSAILEPANGTGNISSCLRNYGYQAIYTADIDPTTSQHSDHIADMTYPLEWQNLMHKKGLRSIDWVISNPPYRGAIDFVENGLLLADRGVAYLLRLSWLEPCLNRRHIFQRYPLTTVIVLPRISFTGNKRTDSITCAWFIWDKDQGKRTISDLLIRW